MRTYKVIARDKYNGILRPVRRHPEKGYELYRPGMSPDPLPPSELGDALATVQAGGGSYDFHVYASDDAPENIECIFRRLSQNLQVAS